MNKSFLFDDEIESCTQVTGTIKPCKFYTWNLFQNLIFNKSNQTRDELVWKLFIDKLLNFKNSRIEKNTLKEN